MNTKIKILIISFIALFGLFMNANVSFAQDTCNSHTVYGDVWVSGGSVNMLTWFNYGKTTSYGETTEPKSITVTAGTPLSVSAVLNNLSENTTYNYVLMMKVGTETRNGGNKSFTTPQCSVSTYTVSTNAGNGGNISPSSRTVNAGETTTFNISANSGYSIDSVYGCNGSLNGNTYTTGAINSNCTVTANFKTNTVIQNPTVILSADNTNVEYGNSTTLRWSSTNASYCLGTNFNTNDRLSGSSTTGNLYNDKSYSITCYGQNGKTATDSVYITVNSQIQNPSVTLIANPSSISSGNSSTISWSSNNANYCVSSSLGSVDTSGTKTVYPTSTTTYSITCYGQNGKTATDSDTVYVNNTQPNVSGNLTLWPSNCTISAGESTCTVSGATWSTSGATDPRLVDRNTGNTLSTIANNSYSPLRVWVAYPQTTFDLKNGSTVLDTKTATASCAYNTSWNGSICANYRENNVPSVNIYADDENLDYGDSTTIRWTTNNNPSSCYASGGSNGWSGSKDEDGGSFRTGSLTYTRTYNITCTNNAGSDSDSVTIYVDDDNYNDYNDRPDVNLYASSTSISYGSSTTIRWNPTNNPTYCTASNGNNNWSGSRSRYSSSFSTGSLYNTTVYTMTCGNNYGSNTESVTVYVNNNQNNQPNVTITADRTNVAYNEGTTIRWYPNNATSCYASGGSNGWSGSKSIYSNTFNTGALKYSTTYTISCSNYNGGTDVKSVTVNVGNQYNIAPENKPTVNIYADSTSLPYYGSTFVRWSSNNATSCTAGGGSLGWEGAKSIGPASFYTGSLNTSKTFSIVCSNSFGSASDSVNVSVRAQANVNTETTSKQKPSSMLLITSSVDRNQPIVPSIDNSKPRPGDEINYNVNYQNFGTGSISGLTLQMNLPQEVSYVSSTPNNPKISSNNLIFNLGTLKANEEGSVTIRVKVRENIPSGTNLNFPAILSYKDSGGDIQSVNANVTAQVLSDTEGKTPEKENIAQGALAFLFGNSFLPDSLLGWMMLILLLTLIVLAIRKMYSTPKATIENNTHHTSH